ncbi:MAG: NAD-dependent epimerase/dehydratase family protein [Candidatus Paceibacterota bacterium]
MKAVVTGGAGFIGSHLCEQLINEGHSVKCVDNLLSGKVDNIMHLIDNPLFEFSYADIRDNLNLAGVDVIFNLAASKKNICLDNPKTDLAINGWGTLNLLQLAQKYGVRKFIHASTGSVYGNVTPQTETSQTIPVSYYGVSKLAGESYVKMFGVDYSILRYFHVYGSRQDSTDKLGGVIAIFIRRIYQNLPLIVYGDGNQTRCFTYVKDVVKANLAMLNKTENNLFNCVSNLHITLNQLIQILFEITGRKVQVLYRDWQIGDIKDFAPSNDRIKELIDFTPFETGLQETIDESRRLYC